ncbi:hypothetical protein HC766_02880 [Candidatus Gracilibacteria bacterium]|nr:hypothetical protein [Candidatus Gracilibacteria bacterium]
MKSGIIKLLIFLVVLFPFAYFGFSIYQDVFTIDPSSPKGEYSIEVESGQSIADLAIQLQKDDVVRNSSYFETLARINEAKPLQVGTYRLNLPAKPSDIITQLNDETSRIEAQIAAIAKTPTVNVTLKEGWTLDEMFDELVDNEVATREELEKFAQNPDNFSRESFEFLPQPLDCEYGNLSNCAKYYPEGYLYPDTYSFLYHQHQLIYLPRCWQTSIPKSGKKLMLPLVQIFITKSF